MCIRDRDYLIYNDPLDYADLILNGDPKEYLKNVSGCLLYTSPARM